MNAPTTVPDRQVQTRRLRRWTWALLALAFALMGVVGSVLDAQIFIASEATSNVVTIGVVLGVLAYFIVRGNPAYRRARASWFGALVIALGMAPMIFVMQSVEYGREIRKVHDIVKSAAERVNGVDRLYAERMKTEFKGSGWAVLSSEAIADAAARKEARASLAAAIKIVDDTLARRATISDEAIVQIQATGAPKAAKEGIIATLRAAAENKASPSLQMMKGTRAFLGKTDEILVHLDGNAGVAVANEDRVDFADSAAAERYTSLMSERAKLEAEMRLLVEKARK